MTLWRTYEFRGRDPNDNPFVDFGFVEVKATGLALTSHMLRQPLGVDGAAGVMGGPPRRGMLERRATAP